MYTQVVDELLDIQLEFEEKLAETEENSKEELEKQRRELEEASATKEEELNFDLEKHKAAIAKLSEKLKEKNEALSKARANTGGAGGSTAMSSVEVQKLQEKLE